MILAIDAAGHCSMTMAMHSSGVAASARDRWLSVLLSLSIQSQLSHRVAAAGPRQRIAMTVFIGLWQRLGQLLGRKSVGETGPQMDGGSSSMVS